MAKRLILLLAATLAWGDNILETQIINKEGAIKTFWNEKVFGAPLVGTRIIELNTLAAPSKVSPSKAGFVMCSLKK
ncbi:MAG: hypothetical protein K6347_00690 [Campylobacterales bacterium]